MPLLRRSKLSLNPATAFQKNDMRAITSCPPLLVSEATASATPGDRITPRSCSAADLLRPLSSDGAPAASAKFRTCSAVNDNAARPPGLSLPPCSLGAPPLGAVHSSTVPGVVFSASWGLATVVVAASRRGSSRKRNGGGAS